MHLACPKEPLLCLSTNFVLFKKKTFLLGFPLNFLKSFLSHRSVEKIVLRNKIMERVFSASLALHLNQLCSFCMMKTFQSSVNFRISEKYVKNFGKILESEKYVKNFSGRILEHGNLLTSSNGSIIYLYIIIPFLNEKHYEPRKSLKNSFIAVKTW